MTNSTTTVEEFDPLDNPQVRAFYDGVKQRQGVLAADRYLETIKPSGGMTATTVLVNTDKHKQRKPAPTLTEPLPTRRSLADAYTFPDDKLPEEEERSESKPTVEGNTTGGYTTPTAAVSQPDPTETTPGHPATSPTVQAETATTEAATPVQALKATSPVTVVTQTAQRKRKPARSTAEVKQAFENALAEFVKTNKPFKRTHVTKAAGLGASFYYTYPSLRTKVDAAIANVGKTKPQSQPERTVETMTSEASTATETLTAATPVEPEPLVTEDTVEPEAALTANTPVETDAGRLATTASTILTSNDRTGAGLTWNDLGGQAAHWRDEQTRLKQQMSQLLDQLDTATENANAYERVLRLHTTNRRRDS